MKRNTKKSIEQESFQKIIQLNKTKVSSLYLQLAILDIM